MSTMRKTVNQRVEYVATPHLVAFPNEAKTPSSVSTRPGKLMNGRVR